MAVAPSQGTAIFIFDPVRLHIARCCPDAEICAMILMAAHASTDDPPVKTRPRVDIETLSAIDPKTLEDSFVYVHCYFNNIYPNMLIRIWKSTFLVDVHSGFRARLVHAENISFAPQWTLIPDNQVYRFLLIFEGLPKSCTQFDLLEDIPQAGGFHVKNIARNQQDVYHIDIV